MSMQSRRTAQANETPTMAKTSQLDPAKYLKSRKALAKYLSDAFETGNAKHAVKAIGTVVRARGMSALARQTGLERVNLFRALYYRENLNLPVTMTLLDAFDMQLVVIPKKK